MELFRKSRYSNFDQQSNMSSVEFVSRKTTVARAQTELQIKDQSKFKANDLSYKQYVTSKLAQINEDLKHNQISIKDLNAKRALAINNTIREGANSCGISSRSRRSRHQALE